MLEQQNKSAELEQMVVHTQNLDITLQELKNLLMPMTLSPIPIIRDVMYTIPSVLQV